MYKRLTVSIEEDLHNAFKSAVAKKGLTIADVVRALVIKWLSEQAAAERGAQDAPNGS